MLLAVAAGGFAQYQARNGVVATPDSIVYEGTAANIHAGRGITSPITTVAVDVAPDEAIKEAGRIPLVQFPPLFPVALSLLGSFGLSPIDAARVLNPTLLGVNVLLAGLVVVSVVGARRWKWMVPVIVLMLTGVPRIQRSPLLLLHGSVLSEPLMIAFVLGSLLALLRASSAALVARVAAGRRRAGQPRHRDEVRRGGHGAHGRPRRPAVGSGPTSGAARLGRGRRQLIGILPTVVVIAVNQALLDGHGHPPAVGSPVKAFEQLATGITQWFVPTTAPTAVRVVLLVVVVVLAAVAWPATRRPRSGCGAMTSVVRQARPVLALLAVTYLLVVVFASRLTFDQNVALWGRHLELLWILVLVIGADLVAERRRSSNRPGTACVVAVASGRRDRHRRPRRR